MVQAYHKSFHLPVIITRSNNVYGPYQYPEKIFPKFIMSLLNSDNLGNGNNTNRNFLGIENNTVFHRNILRAGSRRGIRSGGHCYIHGSGQHSRTYLYVTDVADALDVILHRGEVGQVYNIGGGYEMSNLELAEDLIHRMTQGSSTHLSGDMDRPVKPIAMKQEYGIPPKTQHEHGHTPDQGQLQRPLSKMNGHHKDIFTASRQEAAEQHLSRCRACTDRIIFVEDRAFNDQRYAVDATKLFNLGWSPTVSFEEGIRNTSKAYSSNNDCTVGIFLSC